MLGEACEDLKLGDIRSAEVAREITEVDGGSVILLHASETCRDVSATVECFHRLGTKPKILVLCASEAFSRILTELSGKVHAVIPDHYPSETLTSAIRLVSLGFRIAHEDDVRNMTTRNALSEEVLRSQTRQSVDAYTLLTKREAAILARLRAGLENTTIARELGVSEATVKVHLRAIYRKTGVRNRTQAALWGSDHL